MAGNGLGPDFGILKLKKEDFGDKLARFNEDSSSLLCMLLQWKDLEQHYHGVHENIERREELLRLKEELKERELGDLESRSVELEERRRELESDRERFDLDRIGFSKRAKEVGLKEKRVEEKEKQSEARLGELESDRRIFEVDRGKLEEGLREVESSKKEFNTGMEKLNALLRLLDWRDKQLDGKERAIESRRREIEEQIKEPPKVVELKANQCEGECRGIQNLMLRGCLTVDGKKLQALLNECGDDYEKVRDEVTFLLRVSQDPARVVLDALHLMKGDVELEASTVRASCILLLEQLIKISPDIKEDIKSEAVKLSSDWMSKLRADPEHASQILGFLLLLAAYNLRNAFDDGKIISYAKVIAHWSQVPELCRKLGFRDEMPGFIKDLLERKEHLSAIRFASTFNLLRDFPLDPIMEEYMEISRSAFNAIFYNQHSSVESQDWATNQRIADLEAASRCIEDYKLKCSYSIKQAILKLKNQSAERRKAAGAVGNGFKLQVSNDEFNEVCTSPLISSPASFNMPVSADKSSTEKATVVVGPDTPLQKLQNVEHCATVIFQQALQSSPADSNFSLQSLAPKSEQRQTAELTLEDDLPKKGVTEDVRSASQMNGPAQLQMSSVDVSVKGLRILLRGDVEYKLVQQKVVNMLKSSTEPGDDVFYAIKGPRSSSSGKDGASSKLGIPVKQSILLLNELKQVYSSVKPQLHVVATKFATNYKSRLKTTKNDLMGVIFLLQFSNVYKVCHDADEIISLLDPSIWCKGVPDSCQLLGLQHLIPDLIKSLIKKNKGLDAIRYIVAMKLESRFPVTDILTNHLPFWEKKAQDLLKGPNVTALVQNRAFKMRLDAARDAIKCISMCKLESICPSKVFEEYTEKLEKQKSEKARELEEASLCGLKRRSSECALEYTEKLEKQKSEKSGELEESSLCGLKRKSSECALEYTEKLEKQKSEKAGELVEASLCGLKRKSSECALEEGELSQTASSEVASSTPENDAESQRQTPPQKKKKETT